VIIQFIYVYREKATGRAVYVGSTVDPKTRDSNHKSGEPFLPFDREIARRGRDAFTFEIVEAFSGESVASTKKAAHEREDHWMAVLDTFRADGCFNVARAHGIESSRCSTQRSSTASNASEECIAVAKAQRIPVNVDAEDFQRLKALSDKTGIPASNLLRRALSAWLDENEAKLLKLAPK
jgi:predicted GIY-YIG superfamily endonuclease